MQAPETIEIVEASETCVRGAGLIMGRRARTTHRVVSSCRVLAAVARGSGQTGD